MSQNNTALLALKAVAAKAAKLADDLEHGRLWEGDLSKGIDSIQSDLRDAALSARSQ